jgi:ATP-binding cassette, subfamily F, member 3
MIHVSELSLHFGDRTIFDGLSFSIQAGEKVALIGRNGAGKTTLFRMLAGEYKPDGGRLEVPPGWRIGYLSQDIQPVREETVWEIAMSAYDEPRRLDREIGEIEQALESNSLEGDALEKALIHLSDAHHRLHVLGWEQAEGEVEKVLKGLGFKPEQFQQQLRTFSGGWQVRVWLAKLLLERPDFMMLDEPTNHLDIEAILWLESFLARSEMALLIVSHDRRFLQACTSRVMELVLGRIDDYQMPYNRYLDERLLRMQQRQEAAESQQRKIAQMQATIDRFRAKASKATMAKSMEKQLQKMELVEEFESDDRRMNLRFPPPPRSGERVFSGIRLTKSYGPKVVIRDLDFQVDRGDRVALIGQNGQGKTTLARMITGHLQPDGGRIEESHQVQIGYYAQDQSERLDGKKTVLATLEDAAGPEVRSQVRSILGAFMFSGDDVDKKVSVLSGGERARLALAELMLKPINLLVLDEPTNHLDMAAKDVLKRAVQLYQGTLVVVSHDRDFLSGLCDKIYYFRDGTVQSYLGDIDDFLREQAVADERMLARKTEAAPPVGTASGPDRSSPEWQETRKQARKLLSKAEKEVERLEAECRKLEARMGEPGFYESSDAARITATYQQLRDQLGAAEQDWEMAAEAMEAYED